MNKFDNLGLLIKKEFLSISRDKRSIFTSIFFTLFLTPFIFGLIHFVQIYVQDSTKSQELYIGVSLQDKDDDLIKAIGNLSKVEIKITDNAKDSLQKGSIDSYIDYTFDNNKKIINYVYDEKSNVSLNSVSRIEPEIQKYISNLRTDALSKYNVTDSQINPAVFNPESIQVLNNEKSQDSLFLFFLPYLILLGLMQGSVQYAIDLTSGEKERNTFMTTLSLGVDPILIGISKIIVTLLISLAFTILNFLGILISFSLFSDPSTTKDFALNFSNIIEIFLTILSLSLLTSTFMVLIGIYSRNTKEGNIYAAPIVLLSIFIAFIGTAIDANTPLLVFAFPILGHIAMLKQILLGVFIPINFILLTLISLILFIIIVYFTSKLFKSEKILFRQ